MRLMTTFLGRVQGVGFRYTTLRIARRYAVTGFVQNLVDGSVVLMLEGDPSEIAKMVQEVKDTMRDNISVATHEEGAMTGEFLDFSIRR